MEALRKLKEEVGAKKAEAMMKVNEEVEAKKEMLMKAKEAVEAKKDEAARRVMEEVEDKKEALMKVKEDVEEKIEPVKMFFRGRMVDAIPNIETPFSTIDTAVSAPGAIEYDSDSSDSSKGSAESLNHEKVNGKSRKRHSLRNGDTTSLIASYPAVNSPPVDVVVHQSHGEQIFYPGVNYSGVQESAVKNHQAKIQEQNGNYTPLEKGGTSEHRIVDLGTKTAEEATEIYLEKLYEKQESHEFYCPNCRTCITKVLIIRERYHPEPTPPVIHPIKEELRCSNCFSFLVPVGNWISNIFGPKRPENPVTVAPPTPLPSNLGSGTGGLPVPLLEPTSRYPGSLAIPMPEGEQLPKRAEPRSSKSWQILKSIVYGGLAESITSLGIVTSAASADAATLNVLALALANLIGGLFAIFHNLWEFKNDKSTVKSEETGEQVDRYQEVLGSKENFFLHAPAAILSFLIFGLVPPVVYGLSFRESDDKDLKIAAVAGASLICITLLALAKARTQKNPKYIQTVVQYVGVGFAVAGASYAAGNLLDRLMEQLGWFQKPGDETLSLSRFM